MSLWGEVLAIPPFVEEISKSIAVYYGMHFSIGFTAVFAIVEFIKYINVVSIVTPEFVVIRLVCIMMHFLYLWIHIKGYKRYYKTGKKGYIIISFIGAWIAHCAWNGFFGKLTFSFIKELI